MGTLRFREDAADGGAGAGGVGGAASAGAGGAGGTGAGLVRMDETFFARVYEQVRRVPAGRVCTYGDIARLAGYPGAGREVGLAMSRVQRAWELPCHRIVNAKGTLAPDYAFGGKRNQRALLEAEGVAFSGDVIDMEHFRWPLAPPADAGGDGANQLSLF